MSPIDPAQARVYFERWRLVESTQLQLQRTESLETRLRQLSVLMASKDLFGKDLQREAAERVVRQRWLRLRQAFGD